MSTSCEHCGGYIKQGDGLGSRQAYCRVECWFQATAEEYKRAGDAMGVNLFADLPVPEINIDDLLCDDDDSPSHEAQAQLNELQVLQRQEYFLYDEDDGWTE